MAPRNESSFIRRKEKKTKKRKERERDMSASSQTLSFAANNVTAGKKKELFLASLKPSYSALRALVFLRQSERTSQSPWKHTLHSLYRSVTKDQIEQFIDFPTVLADTLATSIRRAIIVSYIGLISSGVSSMIMNSGKKRKKKYYTICISHRTQMNIRVENVHPLF